MKLIEVGIIGDEDGMFIHLTDTAFTVIIDGVEYEGLIPRGKKSDGNSSPWVVSWMVKPIGPHIDVAGIHDELYEDPFVINVETDEERILTRKECDQIYRYYLLNDTGLLNPQFKAKTQWCKKLWGKIRNQPVQKTYMKDRKSSKLVAWIAYILIRMFAGKAWKMWRKRDDEVKVNIYLGDNYV